MTALGRHWKLGLVWVCSLIAAGALVASAQDFMTTEAPNILSGEDVGFRVERTTNGIPVGKVVVRVDGRWVDAEMRTQ